MTDNEIINALEYIRYHLTASKHKEVIDDAIDVINRQQAEIKEWKRVIETWVMQHEKDKAEIERLQMMVDSDNEVCTECHCEYMDKVHQARVEAIKEFARRLKAKAKDEFMYDYKMLTMATEFVVVKEIDNLVKEMVGE